MNELPRTQRRLDALAGRLAIFLLVLGISLPAQPTFGQDESSESKSAQNAVESGETGEGEVLPIDDIDPHAVWEWLVAIGPRILAVLVVMAVLWRLSRVVGGRIAGGWIRRGEPGEEYQRQQRAETLRRVFQNAADLVIIVFAVLAVLDALGVDVTVLLGGAAVIGAAVAFGSQNLIKDFFSGFMILVENQYSVGNVVRIVDVTGVVEDITLRMTVLRDEEGAVHFVPHGQVTVVSNLTHGWSRAVLRISVGYGENVDRVMTVLMEVARELQADEKFGEFIVGDPEMQGVDAFGDSAVVVKLLVTTKPLKQWAVKRELLRRIKGKFDELGIEIPFPQMVLHQMGGEGGREVQDGTEKGGTP
ncbi:MAG TPA: mechanosensitive ion channel family protein [Lacipirellula sp.]